MISRFFFSTIGNDSEDVLSISFEITHLGVNPLLIMLFESTISLPNMFWYTEVKGDGQSVTIEVPTSVLPLSGNLFIAYHNFGSVVTKINSISFSSGNLISGSTQNESQKPATAYNMTTFNYPVIKKKSFIVSINSGFKGYTGSTPWSVSYVDSSSYSNIPILYEVNGMLLALFAIGGASRPILICSGNPSQSSNWTTGPTSTYTANCVINLGSEIILYNLFGSGSLSVSSNKIAYYINRYNGTGSIISMSIPAVFSNAHPDASIRLYAIQGLIVSPNGKYKMYLRVIDSNPSTSFSFYNYYIYQGTLSSPNENSIGNYTFYYREPVILDNGKIFAVKFDMADSSLKAVLLDSDLIEIHDFNYSMVGHHYYAKGNVVYSKLSGSFTHLVTFDCGSSPSYSSISIMSGLDPEFNYANYNIPKISYSPSEKKIYISKKNGHFEVFPTLSNGMIDVSAGVSEAYYEAATSPAEKDTDISSALSFSSVHIEEQKVISRPIEYMGYLVSVLKVFTTNANTNISIITKPVT